MKTEHLTMKGHVWLLLLFISVMLLMFLAIFFGARIYQTAVSANQNETHLRAVEGYLASALKANDNSGAVSVTAGSQGDVLRIADGATGYETRIYLDNGELVQEYGAVGSPCKPNDATAIAPLQRFGVKRSEQLVTITTDLGIVAETLRSTDAS